MVKPVDVCAGMVGWHVGHNVAVHGPTEAAFTLVFSYLVALGLAFIAEAIFEKDDKQE